MNIKLFPKRSLKVSGIKPKQITFMVWSRPLYVYDVANLYAANWLPTPAVDILMYQSAAVVELMKLWGMHRGNCFLYWIGRRLKTGSQN